MLYREEMRLLSIAALFILACGTPAATTYSGTCAFKDMNNAPIHCFDYSGAMDFTSSAKSACNGANGTWTDSATCARANIVGGCRSEGAGNSTTVWYYPAEATDAAAVMTACNASVGYRYVAP